MIFHNRIDAGEKLSVELSKYRDNKDVVVLGLVRGGVVVADCIAKALHVPLDVVIVRKVGAPDNPELALGAVSDKGKGVFNEDLIHMLGVSKEYLRKEIEKEKAELASRKELFLQGREPLSIEGKIAILVDDGIATGASMKVAIESVRAQKAKKIVVAVPVAAPESLKEISPLVDEIVCLSKPPRFPAVGTFYRDFDQVRDKEVIEILRGE